MKTQRRQIRLTFVASGESVVAETLEDEAPNVCEYVWTHLPIEAKVIHGMYSGLEVFAMIDKPEAVPEANASVPRERSQILSGPIDAQTRIPPRAHPSKYSRWPR